MRPVRFIRYPQVCQKQTFSASDHNFQVNKVKSVLIQNALLFAFRTNCTTIVFSFQIEMLGIEQHIFVEYKNVENLSPVPKSVPTDWSQSAIAKFLRRVYMACMYNTYIKYTFVILQMKYFEYEKKQQQQRRHIHTHANRTHS